MNNSDFLMFKGIAQLTEQELLSMMSTFLKKMYNEDKVQATNSYILAEGKIPVLLVAHMDTVFSTPPKEIYHDSHKDVLWSPQGLGADDRAGIFIIIKMIQEGLRPHIALTTGEERGGIGAGMLVTVHPSAPFDIKYAIQLDRQGICDSVYYDCENIHFEKYINSFGYVTAWGSFSDISIICPTWEIAGVNLSVGYVREHTIGETLFLKGLYATAEKVRTMLKKAHSANHYKYIAANYLSQYNWDIFGGPEDGYSFDSSFRDIHKANTCWKCKKTYTPNDLLEVMSKENPLYDHMYCFNCISDESVGWCRCCGDPFEKSEKSGEDVCPLCKEYRYHGGF